MKKILSLFAIIGIILASNCSRIPVNNDPIIGYWERVEVKATSQTGKNIVLQEWTFNDAYLGRYNQILNHEQTIKTDFGWKEEDGVYTISYPGTDLSDQQVTLLSTDVGDQLVDGQGAVVAIRN